MIRSSLAGAVLSLLVPWSAQAGAISIPGLERPKKPNPAVVALRDYTATLKTNVGDITLKFDPDAAPNAARSFIKLALQGAYDGARFYGAFKDRMILAGEVPSAAGTETGPTIPFEKSSVSHTAGAVALDRRLDSANVCGRFFINLTDQLHLDDDYTVFAEVSEGLDVAKRIGAVATRASDGCPAPIEDIVIERVEVTRKKKADSAKEKSE